MKFQFLGTAAAEGIPALWCDCEVCRRSRAAGGRAFRTRSQAIIDNQLLIDFPADTYAHFLKNNLDLIDVKNVLITHSHSDHLYATDISMLAPGFACVPEGYHLNFYGSDKVGELVKPKVERIPKLASFTEVKAFEPLEVGGYEVTPLKAIHDTNAGPLFYMISDGKKTVLYAHDTHYFCDEVWDYFTKVQPKFDLVSLDCTNVLSPMTYIGHMSFTENKQVRDEFIAKGYATDSTVFVSNHFSHNGKGAFYDDFVVTAAKDGFLVSYDGMIIEI